VIDWRSIRCTLLAVLGLTAAVCGQPPNPAAPPGARPPSSPPSDIDLVEKVLAARREYQLSLEQLRAHYVNTNDTERAKWAEEELRQFHRLSKQAYRLELDVPPPTLHANYNIPEANELYRRAMTYKDKGWGTDYIDNQRRAEILLQQLLTNHPQSDKIGDAAFQLGDLYESKAYKQYRRAAQYFERCFQWNPNTHMDARLRAARLYDRQLTEKGRAMELYKDVIAHETDPKALQEAQKRLTELNTKK
jgi:TolA-binding protein